jgi:hypothetical protein
MTYLTSLEILGLGIILAALYLQGREEKEKIWTSESTMDRFLGKTTPGVGKARP